jgi:hypothetical protein
MGRECSLAVDGGAPSRVGGVEPLARAAVVHWLVATPLRPVASVCFGETKQTPGSVSRVVK